MNKPMPPLTKLPVTDPSRDYYRLHREGIGHVQDMGSDTWTDYNVHDPGITILEALCYAITDIGYRAQWPIQDILTTTSPAADPPYPGQTFYTARDILTVHPATPNDLRRKLIDLPDIRDAWVRCHPGPCQTSYWAWCDHQNQLVLDYAQPSNLPHPASQVWAQGLREVLLELDHDPVLGDLNDRMVVHQSVHHDSEGAHRVTLEMRFPAPSRLNADQWKVFLDHSEASEALFADPDAFQIELLHLGATRDFNLFDLASAQDRDDYLRQHWNDVFYASVVVRLADATPVITFENVTLRAFADNSMRKVATADGWRVLITDTGPNGFISHYRHKAQLTAKAVKGAVNALDGCRSLGEDCCHIGGIGIEDVAVCADIEVRNDADIERVQGAIWFALERYMAPPIPFRTLQELRQRGVPVEDIFNGPPLEHGFIEDADLAEATLKPTLRASDMIRLMMDIDGVVSVNGLRMTKYDEEGLPVRQSGQLSVAWLMPIRANHQPRLYLNQSRFAFYKDGLPFRARFDEANDTLNQLRGQAERPKYADATNDLPLPKGMHRKIENYFPVQYSFPLTYGIGPDGLPPHAPAQRHAQARNLKAYLMVFEQMLGNALAQLTHTADLFSLNPELTHTCFAKAFDDTLIKDLGEIADLDRLHADKVEALLESPLQFQLQRNRFLDHLLARFGESFHEYALLLTQATGQAVALPRLIENKIAFLRRCPELGRLRAHAFNYRNQPGSPANVPGIKPRINLLLGYPDLVFAATEVKKIAGKFQVTFGIADGIGRQRLQGTPKVTASSKQQALELVWQLLLQRMILASAWTIEGDVDNGFELVLKDADATELGRSPDALSDTETAATTRDMLREWAAGERMLVVEHILLRPKFIGDALYPACCDDTCRTCGSADPYSYRLTCVMPGWTEKYTDDLNLRRYAERSIEREMPSHLLAKTCWVGNDGYVENPCDEVVDQLAELLTHKGRTSDHAAPTEAQACHCATNILHAFSSKFSTWFADKKLSCQHRDAWTTQINKLFENMAKPKKTDCAVVFTAPLWSAVHALMTEHFVDIALHGWQFERFEWAWLKWLQANAKVDWSGERLVERTAALLAANVQAPIPAADTLQALARDIVTTHGSAFHTWMQSNLAAGHKYAELTAFVPPPVTLPADFDFSPDTQTAIADLLSTHYTNYAEPSYWLSIVVTLLAGLRNTWPDATLHDCDEGSDSNPVRLNNTALGSHPNRTTL